MTRIEQDRADWQMGYVAGASGRSSAALPDEVVDRLAYASGVIEGRAAARRNALPIFVVRRQSVGAAG